MILPHDFNVWLHKEPSDMRKAINGLSILVIEHFKSNLQTGDLFVFYNRKKDRVKILYWHYNGFCILQKRLERSTFKMPEELNDPISLTEKQLARLVEGLHFVNDNKNEYDIFY